MENKFKSNRLEQLLQESLEEDKINIKESLQVAYQNDGKMVGKFKVILYYLKVNGIESAKIIGESSKSNFDDKGLPTDRKEKTIEVRDNELTDAKNLIEGLIQTCQREKSMMSVFFENL
jgi:hypothetical protein